MGGLIWAYLGPKPAPLLPRWDLLVWDNVVRSIESTVLPCNWVQIQENSVDSVHLEWLHGHYGSWVLQRKGRPTDWLAMFRRRHLKLGIDRFK